jgi:DNA-binding HxlR family transcriptional regulator
MTREDRPRWLRPSNVPQLSYLADPLGASVRALNQKWTLLILRDLAFLHLTRFTEFLRNNPGLTPRVLSRRLKEMQREELVRRTGGGKNVTYALTPRGQDAVLILLAFLNYGLKHHAKR